MMRWRSLLVKQVLALLFVSITAVLIAGVFLRITTQQGFDTYVQAQAKHELATQLGTYYQAMGSWQGVAAVFQPTGTPPGGVPFTVLDQANVVVVAGAGHTLGEVVAPTVSAQATPIRVANRVVGRVLVSPAIPNNALAQAYRNRLNAALLLASAVAILIALALALLLSTSLTRPVRALTHALHAMTAGELRQEVAVVSHDELGELAQAFNHMSAEIALANQQRRQMTADIAHDLQTPVMLIAGYITAIREGILPLTAERLTVLAEESQRLQRLIEDLRTLSLAEAGELSLQCEMVDPGVIVERLIATYHDQATQQGIVLHRQIAAPLPLVAIDAERMLQVLGNLMVNALRHTPAGGTITLGARAGSQGVVLTVRDTGSGIAPDVLARIFDRFYRGDRARTTANGASGLGLAIAKALVEMHGGTIAVTSRVGQGTRFAVALPQATPQLHQI